MEQRVNSQEEKCRLLCEQTLHSYQSLEARVLGLEHKLYALFGGLAALQIVMQVLFNHFVKK